MVDFDFENVTEVCHQPRHKWGSLVSQDLGWYAYLIEEHKQFLGDDLGHGLVEGHCFGISRSIIHYH